MFGAVVDLLEILKFVAQPLVGSVRLLFTAVVFCVLVSRDTGSVSDFTCHPETTDWATQECFSTYSAEMSSFMHPQFFVIITAVVLFSFWSVMINPDFQIFFFLQQVMMTTSAAKQRECVKLMLCHVALPSQATRVVIKVSLDSCL